MSEPEERGARDAVVDVTTLEYGGKAALERARTLREPLERAIAEGRPGPILDELFDLIRLGTR